VVTLGKQSALQLHKHSAQMGQDLHSSSTATSSMSAVEMDPIVVLCGVFSCCCSDCADLESCSAGCVTVGSATCPSPSVPSRAMVSSECPSFD